MLGPSGVGMCHVFWLLKLVWKPYLHSGNFLTSESFLSKTEARNPTLPALPLQIRVQHVTRTPTISCIYRRHQLGMRTTRQWTWRGSDLLGRAGNQGAPLWKSGSYKAEALAQMGQCTNYNIYSSEGAAAWVPRVTSSAVGVRTCFKFFRKYHLPTQRWWESPSILLTSCFCAPPARDSFCWLQLRALGGTSTDFHPLKKGPLCLSEPTLIRGYPRGLPWTLLSIFIHALPRDAALPTALLLHALPEL